MILLFIAHLVSWTTDCSQLHYIESSEGIQKVVSCITKCIKLHDYYVSAGLHFARPEYSIVVVVANLYVQTTGGRI